MYINIFANIRSSNLIWIFQQKKQKYYKEYNINRYEIKIDMFEKIIFIFFLVCVIAFVSNAFHVVRVYGIANTKNHTMVTALWDIWHL